MIPVGIPVPQLLQFGFAINTAPKYLPTAVLVQDDSVYARRLVAAMQTGGYFALSAQPRSETDVEVLMAHGRARFLLTSPSDFTRRLVRDILLKGNGLMELWPAAGRLSRPPLPIRSSRRT